MPESEGFRFSRNRKEPAAIGLSLWSQDIVGVGLPKAKQDNSRDSPGCLIILVGLESVLLVNIGAAIRRSRLSPDGLGFVTISSTLTETDPNPLTALH